MTRSMLFVPGDSERKIEKALASEAEAVILDLEDSVAPDGKVRARQVTIAALAGDRRSKQLWVRVNALESGLMLSDLAAVIPHHPFGILVPKCAGRPTLQTVAHYLDALEVAAGLPQGVVHILPIATETARSIFALGDYADVTPRLWGLTWGAEDLAADVGSLSNQATAAPGYSEPFRQVRSLCLFAAAAAGVRAIDAVCVRMEDHDTLIQEAADASRDGFTGKLAIHPNQLSPIHDAFAPTEAQIDWARRVVAAFAAAPEAGALRLDGVMIDKPHLRLARRLMRLD
ncbi:MAG: CoA ester lyase [Ottowia sp.]|uniref:HpcH/HpaI aldolase/citrate lyase family protein n=1 Tax=Ottowia sp. TaxID=1898956 RepID=UPI003C763E91